MSIPNPQSAIRNPQSKRRILVLAGVVVVLTVVVLLALRYGRPLWTLFRDPDRLRALIAGWGAWGPFGVIGIQVLQIVLAPLPGPVVSYLGGYIFGHLKAFALSMTGVMIGSAIAFSISKVVGRRLLGAVIPKETMDKFDTFIARRGPFYVFLLLIIPNPVGDWLYYLAGLTILPLPVFMFFVLVARAPSNFVESFIGSQAYKLGTGAYHLAWWQWTLFIAVLVTLVGLYWLNRKRIEAALLRFVKFPIETPPPAD